MGNLDWVVSMGEPGLSGLHEETGLSGLHGDPGLSGIHPWGT